MIKILIIQLSALGDIIYTLHSVKRLFHSLTDCQIDWLYKTKNDILENQVEINKAIHYKEISSIKNKYDYIIDFGTKTNTLYLKYRLDGTKIGFISQKKKFVSWFNDYSLNFNKNIPVVDNQIMLIEFLCKLLNHNITQNDKFQINCSSYMKNKINNYLNNFRNKKIVAFNPNSTYIKKELDVNQWSEIFDKLKYDDNIIYILIGSEFGNIGKMLKNKINENNYKIELLPNMSILEISYFISQIDLLVSIDTSILHLAEFQKIKTIGIFLIEEYSIMKSWNNCELKDYQITLKNINKINNNILKLISL